MSAIRQAQAISQLAVVLLWAAPLAAFQTPPAQTGPTYSAKFNLDQEYNGTATFAVDAKGAVTGELTVDPPGVRMTLSGAVKDGVWTFEKMPYTIAAENCSGVVSGTAKVPVDRGVITGQIHVEGGCTEQPMDGTFTFTKTPKS
jgi:hypothetical protein